MVKTPLSLQIIGCKDLPLLYTQNHLRKAIKTGKSHYRNLDIENLLFVQKEIKNPLIIADSITDNESIIVFTAEKDKNDDLIILAIKPNGKGQYLAKELDSNIIKSIYGKKNYADFIQRLYEQDKILYLNKKRVKDFPSLLQLQLLQSFENSLNPMIIIKQSENIVNAKADKNILPSGSKRK